MVGYNQPHQLALSEPLDSGAVYITKRATEAFDTSKSKKETNARRYFHCSFAATAKKPKKHSTPKDTFIRDTSVSELKFHPVKVKIAFIFLQVFYD